MQYSVAVNNARLDAIETTIGTSPKLRFYSGAMPANCAAARSGTLLAEGALPSDWLSNAAAAQKAKAGAWQATGQAGAGSGTNIGYYSIMDSTGATCHEQGTVTVTGGGGDMTVDNINVANAQVITVNTYTKNAGNQ